ncbi:serine carboxypeptidase-like 31 isoform X2 [Spinacia oleracea]|uniref:Carboxypeptidase n=1 Tax=Spinacia oleracea TaxID=3562 RepID=A0A9R0IE27_SPIOL|nr:serine carboxypeptidase-like 31 isoform X2 [Spinacia oleracea]
MDFTKTPFYVFVIIIVLLLYIEPIDSSRLKIKPSYIDNNEENPSENNHLVTNLPGQPDVNFRHYAGYVTVYQKNQRALFYWFYEASSLPDEKPLVLWLNGGPGCSSVGYGATQEIGPFLVHTNGGGLKFNPFSWNKANDAYEFIQKWFLKFPTYRNRTFYIAGESYAGKYVPELAELIHDRNNGSSLYVDLKGILMGNPETSDPDDWRGLVDYAWSHAVVSDETHKIIRDSCDFNSDNTWNNPDCSQAVDEVLKQYKEIDIYSLYTAVCIANSTKNGSGSMEVMFKSTSKMMPRIMGGYDPCLDDYARSYYNRPDVQKALHVSDGVLLRNWSICNLTIFSNWADSKPSVLPIYKKLISAGLRIWVYSGDTDGRVPVLSTRYSLNALGLPIIKPWRPWYHEKQVSGWYQEYKGVTFATFRGAGHAVPIFKPSSSLALFTYFLQAQSLPSAR